MPNNQTRVSPGVKNSGAKVYRPILKKAWEITRQNKFLWIFGFFAALVGNGGVYEIFVKGFDRVTSRGEIFLQKTNWLWDQSIFALPRLEQVYKQAPLFVYLFWIIVLAVLLVLGLLICFSIASRGALIGCVKKILGRRKTGFKDGWQTGLKFFWPVFGLNVLARALTFGLLVMTALPVMFFITGGNGGAGWNLFLYILAFVVFSLLALLISFMTIYASSFVVINNQTFTEAVRSGWRLFIRNWLVSVEMALILFLIILGAGVGVVLFSLFYFIPITLLLVAFAYLGLSSGFWLVIVLAALGWIFSLCVVGAMLSTFQFSAWTLLFLELNKKVVWSKLLRFIGILNNNH